MYVDWFVVYPIFSVFVLLLLLCNINIRNIILLSYTYSVRRWSRSRLITLKHRRFFSQVSTFFSFSTRRFTGVFEGQAETGKYYDVVLWRVKKSLFFFFHMTMDTSVWNTCPVFHSWNGRNRTSPVNFRNWLYV